VTGLAAWLRDPALAPLWAAARERLERNGIEPRGVVVLSDLPRECRHALGGLLGRSVLHDRVRVDLAEVDAQLLERADHGLVSLVSELTGALTNRPAQRSERQASRAAPFERLRSWLAEQPGREQPWTEEWLAGVRSSGVLARVIDPDAATRALVQAARIATGLVAAPSSGVPRNELAARSVGNAHALDDGELCGSLVLRALAVVSGIDLPRGTSERRALWEAYGVPSDTVSSTVLTLGLVPNGDTALARRLRQAAESGAPVHLTAWDLDRAGDLQVGQSPLLVCENPRVLEAAATAFGGRHAVVCSAGMPSPLAVRLLQTLVRDGTSLRYHGDFDWPGIAIANRLLRDVGCLPWRMSSGDYLAAARDDGLPLAGAPVEPGWDDALGEAMRRRGVAVHEEAALDELLRALPSLAS
jgi:uncharacterized protein (TIGR02679 family)